MTPVPRVSVVLPTYNQAHYLPEALDGLLAQTLSDFELIIVNDGSTNSTPEILEQYRRRRAFRLVTQVNRGLPGALNVGFSHASGQYLTWTSSDNVLEPTMLDELAAALDCSPGVGLVYSGWYVTDDEGQVLARAMPIAYDRLLLLRYNYVNSCFLYRRECRLQVGDYDAQLAHVEDWDYNLRIAAHFDLRRVERYLGHYRSHRESQTAQVARRDEQGAIYRRFARRWRAHDPLAWYLAKLRWLWLRGILGRQPTVHFEAMTEAGDGVR